MVIERILFNLFIVNKFFCFFSGGGEEKEKEEEKEEETEVKARKKNFIRDVNIF